MISRPRADPADRSIEWTALEPSTCSTTDSCSFAARAGTAGAFDPGAGAQPLVAEILAATRKAIGDRKLDALKTFSVQSALQRNCRRCRSVPTSRSCSICPDKYLRVETSSSPGMVLSGGGGTGFNGDRPLQKIEAAAPPGGGMVFRMGGPGGAAPGGEAPKPTAGAARRR